MTRGLAGMTRVHAKIAMRLHVVWFHSRSRRSPLMHERVRKDREYPREASGPAVSSVLARESIADAGQTLAAIALHLPVPRNLFRNGPSPSRQGRRIATLHVGKCTAQGGDQDESFLFPGVELGVCWYGACLRINSRSTVHRITVEARCESMRPCTVRLSPAPRPAKHQRKNRTHELAAAGATSVRQLGPASRSKHAPKESRRGRATIGSHPAGSPVTDTTSIMPIAPIQ